MGIERGFFVDVQRRDNLGASKKEIGEECERVLVVALNDLVEDPLAIRLGLEAVERGYEARPFSSPGESGRLSPVRATTLFLSRFYALSMQEDAEASPSSISESLMHVSFGMEHVLGTIIQAESAIYAGSREYGAFMLEDAGYDGSDEDMLGAFAEITQGYIDCLKGDPSGITLLGEEIVNMHMLMAGYDKYLGEAIEPKDVYNPMNLRGAKFAKDAYRIVYPHAVKVFGNGNGNK